VEFFALYALVKRTKIKWLIIPAIIGGSALLADGIITPPISVSSAVEGVRTFYPQINTIPIVIGILVILFTIQQFGTKLVGKFFAPIMLVWFLMLGVVGALQIMGNYEVLKAINPYYAYKILIADDGVNPEGFFHPRVCLSMYHRSRSFVFRHGTLRQEKHPHQLDFCKNHFGAQLFRTSGLSH